jgi:hypothetical protein
MHLSICSASLKAGSRIEISLSGSLLFNQLHSFPSWKNK